MYVNKFLYYQPKSSQCREKPDVRDQWLVIAYKCHTLTLVQNNNNKGINQLIGIVLLHENFGLLTK